MPDLTAALAALGDQEFETVGDGVDRRRPRSTPSMQGWDHDGDNGRWAWTRQLYGHVYAAKDGTQRHAADVRLGPQRRARHHLRL